jgi:hypothetical protein
MRILTAYRRVALSFAAALEALRAPLRSRRMASERVISSRFAHRSIALIVSVGSRTLINGSTSAVGRPILDWTIFGMADPLLNRIIIGYIRQSIVRHKRDLEYRIVALSEMHHGARRWTWADTRWLSRAATDR